MLDDLRHENQSSNLIKMQLLIKTTQKILDNKSVVKVPLLQSLWRKRFLEKFLQQVFIISDISFHSFSIFRPYWKKSKFYHPVLNILIF